MNTDDRLSWAPAKLELDDLDLRIIAQLQDDGRKPSSEIARELDVPRTTVARRIERLVSDNVITIGVYANGPKIGLPVHVMIQLDVEPNKYESVIDAVAALDEVRWVGITTGPCDVLVEGLFRSDEHLRFFLLKRMSKISGISGMQSVRILDVVKITFDWERMRHADEESVPPGGGVRPIPDDSLALECRPLQQHQRYVATDHSSS